MKAKYKGAYDALNINQSNLTTNQKSLVQSNFRRSHISSQCIRCNSDYMKFSVNGFCQNCQQKAEFVKREHSNLLDQNKNKEVRKR
jgi:hypothetical protein